MSDNDEKLAQFQSITGCDQERAQFYLESANWQIDLAMASFYEGEGDMDIGGGQAPVSEAVAPPPVDPEAIRPGGGSGSGAGIGRINFGGGGSDSDDSDSEQQAFFAGGSSHSGNVILGPKKKKFNVGDMFKAARDAGAEAIDPSESGAGPSGGLKAFQGGGFKLGSDTTESVQVGGGQPKRPEPRHFVLKMWREGFSLDDGDLREYNDPGNREFLASVMRGTIPPELVKEAKGGEVHVDMEDHREEEFVKPKVKAKPFQGSGNVLGSIAPSVTPPTASPALDPAQAEKTAQEKTGFDGGKPVANIQVRLADGSRLIVKLNHEHTVADLRMYINTARPQYEGVSYALMTTFPNKELTEDTATIAGAGLVGAAVLQRLK